MAREITPEEEELLPMAMLLAKQLIQANAMVVLYRNKTERLGELVELYLEPTQLNSSTDKHIVVCGYYGMADAKGQYDPCRSYNFKLSRCQHANLVERQVNTNLVREMAAKSSYWKLTVEEKWRSLLGNH